MSTMMSLSADDEAKELFLQGLQSHFGLGNDEGGVDCDKAFELFQRSYTLGYLPSAVFMAYRFYYGCYGVTRDGEKAKTLCVEALNQGLKEQEDEWSQVCFGFLYFWGFCVPRDIKKSLELFLRVSVQFNNSIAQERLGEYYRCGYGGVQNHALALEHYLKSANQNHCQAQYVSGLRYYHGVYGIEKDVNEGIKLFKLSANQNYFNAQSFLGDIYFEGKNGVKKDFNEAAVWYQQCADNDNYSNGKVEYQYKLGEIYLLGDEESNFPKNDAKALEYFYLPFL